MKNIMILAILMFLFSANAQVEKIALEVLKAYKDQDVELLKKYASGIMKPAINKSYFEDENIKKDLEVLASWDGKIKEIRYNSDDIMGNFIVVASAYYSDRSENEINIVVLSIMDGKNWVFLGSGLETVPKADFMKLATTIPKSQEKGDEKTRSEKTASSKGKMDIELASGDQFKNVNESKLVESFNSMDDDNFFMILSNGDDFVQAAYSDGNYVVEYSVGGVQYEANKVLQKETSLNVFKKYLLGESDWLEGVEWVKK